MKPEILIFSFYVVCLTLEIEPWKSKLNFHLIKRRMFLKFYSQFMFAGVFIDVSL